ncbi:hydantoinase B/oxoprolinase family protein [Cryobacterium sp. CG_9.6]|uniref:hydantoinase B/oxoprolinase family protein n=1 Tax=Cryobacterium sp. CG_9.6 TaxID=2760710 RepID=UPI002473A7D4|nr:hydantoinase B/oxoprolinase family protein [Cryobacterium sp. CG_9.6]MDH6236103.1 N-methylhydantoinase B/oxoprolinase/acetone carboxylase alpha subunit [Cryobacterium sp. CG_9.6]
MTLTTDEFVPASDDGTTSQELTTQEQEWVDKFMDETTLFLGPDPAIMRHHEIMPRSAYEEECIAQGINPLEVDRIRKRLAGALDEAFEMCESMGAAPGAKWADLSCAVYTAEGDVTYLSNRGVIAFSAVLHHPIRYIMKNWKDEPTVGINEGDGFFHNDSRFGMVHNTDQSMLVPVIRGGIIIAWVGATIHEGENGACEPGGMPSGSETPFDDGLRASPIKIVEKGHLRRDLLTFLQHSTRDPKLMLADIKVKMGAVRRIMDTVDRLIDEVGQETFVASLRVTVEDVETEVRRRIGELPDGTVTFNQFVDSTLKENILIKFACKITIKGERLIVDLTGTGPEILNRAINSPLASTKSFMAQAILSYWWPDLPRSTGAMSPIEVITEEHSWADAGYDAPVGQSLQASFRGFSALQTAFAKMQFSAPQKYSNVVAPWFNQINDFLWGGTTQNGEQVGNLCADLNGMGGGAKAFRDGEDAVAPLFCAMADIGEQEVMEEEVPFLQLVSKRIVRDNQGFGKFRGGMGYEMIVASRGTPSWGFMTVTSGSKFSSVPGMFGGYGCPVYPLAMVKGINIYDIIRDDPSQFNLSMERVMNEQPFEGGDYQSAHMGLQFDVAKEGELYMIAQGAGGGYGDVLERDPELVVTDLELDRISAHTASTMYGVVWEPETYVVHEEATIELRAQMRRDRISRGTPYKEFVEKFVQEEPPADLLYFGSWGQDNDEELLATHWGGIEPERVKGKLEDLPLIMVPDRRVLKISKLEARVRELEEKYGEVVEHKS